MEEIKYSDLNEYITNNEKIVIFFHTKWCGQCQMAKLLIDKIKKDFPKINFFGVDADENNLWNDSSLNLKEVPTFKIWKNKEMVGNFSGYQMEEDLRNILNEKLN